MVVEIGPDCWDMIMKLNLQLDYIEVIKELKQTHMWYMRGRSSRRYNIKTGEYVDFRLVRDFEWRSPGYKKLHTLYYINRLKNNKYIYLK